jgi:hypothetical protein
MAKRKKPDPATKGSSKGRKKKPIRNTSQAPPPVPPLPTSTSGSGNQQWLDIFFAQGGEFTAPSTQERAESIPTITPERIVPLVEFKEENGQSVLMYLENVEGVGIGSPSRTELDAMRIAALAGRASMKPKPRNVKRDAAIVRLHDQKKVPFKQIGRRLMKENGQWCGDDGKPLGSEAVRQAYYRARKRGGTPPD